MIVDGVLLDDRQQSPRKYPVLADDVTGEFWYLQEAYVLSSPTGFGIFRGLYGRQVIFKRVASVRIIPPTPEQILLFRERREIAAERGDQCAESKQALVDVVRSNESRRLLN
jgi:hypothetical protein